MREGGHHEEIGIVLRRARFAESSLIVTWITPGRGKLKTSVRSALRPGTAFCGRVELFHRVRICWRETGRGEVHALSEAEVVGGFQPPVAEAHRALRAASYFSALVEKLVPPDEGAPEIFDLLTRALNHLNSEPPRLRAVLFFERELARLLGILDPRDVSTASPAAALTAYAGGLPSGREALLQAISGE